MHTMDRKKKQNRVKGIRSAREERVTISNQATWVGFYTKGNAWI